MMLMQPEAISRVLKEEKSMVISIVTALIESKIERIHVVLDHLGTLL